MHRTPLILSTLLLTLLPRPTLALEPHEIAILFNANSPNSLAVARHYLTVRKIPPNHLIPINCDAADDLPEHFYRNSVIPQVTRALAQQKLLPDPANGIAGVKCLVTVYGMPLRIAARIPTAVESQEVANLQKQLDETVALLEKSITLYNSIATPTPPATAPATVPAPATPKLTWQQVAPRLNEAANAAAGRIETLQPAQRVRPISQLIQVQEQVAGVTGIVSVFQIPANATGPDVDAARQRLQTLTTQLKEMQEKYLALIRQREDPRIRAEMITLRRSAEGFVGQARCLEELLNYLKPENSSACFDNELALVLADQNYPRANWVNNPKLIENYEALRHLPADQLPRTLMVARLDGLNAPKALELIDRALAVELTGLDGKCYLDARGIRGTDAYALFDADLRRAHDWLRDNSTIPTTLDDTPELFKAENAPDCAIYAGWYSLHNYQDSAKWVKGAVGYHIASLEMLSFHNAGETGWVHNLLTRGFAGTLGATEEPYLTSFPKPSLFIPLLLSGQFTQGEVWQITAPMLSWRVGMVGDPLYNPFKAKPRVTTKALLDHTILKNAYPLLNREPPKTP